MFEKEVILQLKHSRRLGFTSVKIGVYWLFMSFLLIRLQLLLKINDRATIIVN